MNGIPVAICHVQVGVWDPPTSRKTSPRSYGLNDSFIDHSNLSTFIGYSIESVSSYPYAICIAEQKNTILSPSLGTASTF
jgi:hypothetical protein